jgi:hypothetical protein
MRKDLVKIPDARIEVDYLNFDTHYQIFYSPKDDEFFFGCDNILESNIYYPYDYNYPYHIAEKWLKSLSELHLPSDFMLALFVEHYSYSWEYVLDTRIQGYIDDTIRLSTYALVTSQKEEPMVNAILLRPFPDHETLADALDIIDYKKTIGAIG